MKKCITKEDLRNFEKLIRKGFKDSWGCEVDSDEVELMAGADDIGGTVYEETLIATSKIFLIQAMIDLIDNR